MSAIEHHRQVLGRLAVGDQVRPIEDLKRRIATLIGRPESHEPHTDPFDSVSEHAEAVLALAFPLLEHGGPFARRTPVLAMQVLAEQARDAPRHNRSLTLLTLHHLVWSMAAYCLRHDVLEPLPALAAVAVPNANGGFRSVFESSELRHADVLTHDADQTFTALVKWFERTALMDELPLFIGRRDVQIYLAEADLIAALRTTPAQGRAFCPSVGLGGEERIRARVGTRRAAACLAEVFDVQPEDLRPQLQKAYRLLEVADHLRRSGPLFPDSAGEGLS